MTTDQGVAEKLQIDERGNDLDVGRLEVHLRLRLEDFQGSCGYRSASLALAASRPKSINETAVRLWVSGERLMDNWMKRKERE